MSKGRLAELVGSYIPDMYLDYAKGPEKWVHFIEDAYRKVSVFIENQRIQLKSIGKYTL